MKKHFYHSIITIDALQISLEKLKISPEEKKHLLDIAHSNMHYAILDTVLSQLTETDKKIFLDHVALSPHKKTWEFLKGKTTNIDEKIQKTANKLLEELQKDIEETKD